MWKGLIWSCTLAIILLNMQSENLKNEDDFTFDISMPYQVSAGADAETRIQVSAEERDWLWKHWKLKRRGLLIVTAFSKEGEPSTSFYFVEESPNGGWHVAVRIHRILADMRHPKEKFIEVRQFEARAVERVQMDIATGKTGTTFPENEDRPSSTYQIVLKDDRGNVVSSL
jgi:hypothetical protein